MQTLSRLLAAAKATTEPPTMNALAARLGVSRQTLYDWKNAAQEIGGDHLARLIAFANAAPEAAIEVRREHAKSHHERAMWTTLARRLGTAAAVALCAVAVPLMADGSMAYVLPFLPMHLMSIALVVVATWAALRSNRRAEGSTA